MSGCHCFVGNEMSSKIYFSMKKPEKLKKNERKYLWKLVIEMLDIDLKILFVMPCKLYEWHARRKLHTRMKNKQEINLRCMRLAKVEKRGETKTI